MSLQCETVARVGIFHRLRCHFTLMRAKARAPFARLQSHAFPFRHSRVSFTVRWVDQALGKLAYWVRAFFRLHWKAALLLRDKLRVNEDALHLVMAGIVGLIGGGTNLAYHASNQFIKWIAFGSGGDFL